MTKDDLHKIYQEEKSKNPCRWCCQFENDGCGFVPGGCDKDNPLSVRNYYFSKPWIEIEDQLIALYIKKIEDENKEYESKVAEAKKIVKEILELDDMAYTELRKRAERFVET